MRRCSALLPLALLAFAACTPGADAPLAPPAHPSALYADGDEPGTMPSAVRWLNLTQPYRAELEAASRGLLYTSESDYPFDYVSRPVFLPDTLTLATFRIAFAIPRTTPVEVRSLDRVFARHIELVDPADAAAVALVPRYENLKDQLEELLNAPKGYCVGTISIRCYLVGTSPQGVVAGLATTSIET